MKMTKRLATLLTILATTGPLLSATEVEQLRKLCAEQEMQIAQLEQKISRLTNTPPEEKSAKSIPVATSEPKQRAASDSTYTVKPGDSVERIANKHNMSVSALAKLNGLKTNSIIHPNQKLIISKGESRAPSAPAQNNTARQEVYKIQPGDTLYKISRKYGVSVNHLMDSNPGIQPTTLRVGDTINVTATAKPAPEKQPAPSLSTGPAIPISNTPAPAPAPVVEKKQPTSKGPIKIDTEITYGEFAQNYNTTAQRLDELNGLSLDPSTVLAQGSELYIPAQP
ncbi:LysM peptidoglycan-binding domain-containing protein [Luteolibacter sp. AS25]|uniref:LysM peptidoglycan-binding domain-containing protein n=1 Tax=Luteolibacter sp. AS25 TaxID=3135776 RepID=UPI00398AE83E